MYSYKEERLEGYLAKLNLALVSNRPITKESINIYNNITKLWKSYVNPYIELSR